MQQKASPLFSISASHIFRVREYVRIFGAAHNADIEPEMHFKNRFWL
jgi:hypothetical protein